MSEWYYADRQQQQQGPVDATWMQAAFGRGEVTASTLVWHEGMAQWQPLSQVAAQLGIAVAARPAAAPAAVSAGGRPVAVAPARRGTPVWVILLIIAGAMIPVLGIIAAIAIPAYHDYASRAKVSEAVMSASSLRIQVEEFVLTEDRCPTDGEGGIEIPAAYAGKTLESVQVGELADEPGICTVELVLRDVPWQGDRHSLTMIRRDVSNWTYRTSLPTQQLPASIRYALED